MARNNMNFSASLKLNTKEFRKGIADVQRSLKGLQSTFLSVAGALGAGLGLASLLSNLRETAVQLSVAKNVLENVSHTTQKWETATKEGTITLSNYGENLEFVRKLAKDYRQDLTTLINSFAQFHAACEGTNITLDQQRKIYESLTKAAAFYHMSTERTRDMNTAIIQMASKGRITAEELRRQLGNNLPGAFNLMAAALKISTAQLDDLMKKGKVASEDALPKFAAMLKTITTGIKFDSLQMSLNTLKNTWTEMVENSNFDRLYKGIVDGATSVVGYMSHNFWPTIFGIGGSFVGLAAKNGFVRLRESAVKETAAVKKEWQRLDTSLEKQFDKLSQNRFATVQKDFADNRSYPLIKFDRETARNATRSALANNGIEEYIKVGEEAKKAEKAILAYNKTLEQTARLNRGGAFRREGKIYSRQDLNTIKEYNRELSRSINESERLKTGLKKVGGEVSVVNRWFKALGASILQAFASMGVMAIVGWLTSLVAKQIQYNKELKEAKGLVDEYHKSVESVNEGVAANAAELESNLRILQDTSKSESARIRALERINELTGEKYSSEIIKQKDAINEQNKALGKTANAYQDIIDNVKKWIEATKLQAKIQIQAQKQAEAEAANARMEQENRELYEKIANPANLSEQFQRRAYRRRAYINEEAIASNNRIIKETTKALDELGVSLSEVYKQPKGGDNPFDKETKLKGIPKIMDEYKNAVNELNASLSQGIINQEDYQKQLDKLIIDTWEKAAKTGKLDINDIIAKMDKGGTLTAMEQWYYDIAKAARQAARNALQEGIEDDIIKGVEDWIKELDKQLEELSNKYGEANATDIEVATKTKRPDFKPRNSILDYSKDKSEILEEEAEIQKKWAKEVEDYIEDIKGKYKDIALAGKEVQDELAAWEQEMVKATAAAESLEAAMRYEKIKEDIKDMRKTIADSYASGLKGLAGDMDRVIKGLESIRSTMDSTDASAWDKFMVIFNEVAQIADMVVGVIDTFNKVQETTAKLAGAELAQSAALIEMQQKKVNLERELYIWKAKNAGMTNAAVAAEIAEAAASRTNASAKASEAIAGGTASAAKLPFPWNIAAIFTTVATIYGILGSMKKYEKGGVVGGSSYNGDTQLARVNSGEMVINRGQQARLWNFIKNGSNGYGGGKVEFELRGDRLLGAIKNYESRRKG